jgi:hypothetical protein
MKLVVSTVVLLLGLLIWQFKDTLDPHLDFFTFETVSPFLGETDVLNLTHSLTTGMEDKGSDTPLKPPIRVIVTGATGTLGAELLDQCLAEPRIEGVTALVRKDLNISHPKLTVIKLEDFKDYSKVEDQLKNHHACYWALGIFVFTGSNLRGTNGIQSSFS